MSSIPSFQSDASNNLVLTSGSNNGMMYFATDRTSLKSGRLYFMKPNLSIASGTTINLFTVTTSDSSGGILFDVRLNGTFTNFNGVSYRYLFTVGTSTTTNIVVQGSSVISSGSSLTTITDMTTIDNNVTLATTKCPYLGITNNAKTTTISIMAQSGYPATMSIYTECYVGGNAAYQISPL